MGERIYDQREDNLRAMHERGERSLMERSDLGRIVPPHGSGPTDVLPGALGYRVHLHRQARGLSLRDVEMETGIAFSAIGRIERGETAAPTPETVQALRYWLGDDVPPPHRRSDGWPPVVPVPLSVDHARAMVRAGERYLMEAGYDGDI